VGFVSLAFIILPYGDFVCFSSGLLGISALYLDIDKEDSKKILKETKMRKKTERK